MLRNLYDQMPDPKVVVVVGTCGLLGRGVFHNCYNVIGGLIRSSRRRLRAWLRGQARGDYRRRGARPSAAEGEERGQDSGRAADEHACSCEDELAEAVG